MGALHRAWEQLTNFRYKEAARQYEDLAARGSINALISLGWMHTHGKLGPPDLDKAILFYESAVSAGSVRAKYRLARVLLRKNEAERARALLVEAGLQGHKPSIYWAGRMMTRGEGGDVDTDTGIAWLNHAADSGHAFARRELLRVERKDSRSPWRHIWLYCRLISLAFVVIPRMMKDPYGDDFY